MVTLLCPVRDCGRPLAWGARSVDCPSGHHFDLARSGYCNLLQPQDRRSRHAGDAKAVVLARRRTLARGLGEPLLCALAAQIGELAASRALLDVGCGEGFFLAGLGAALRELIEGWGVDLSADAIDAAARRHTHHRWVVANADRRLPFADASFDVLLSVTGPKNPTEFHRLLRRKGRLLLAVPGPEDLVELRALLQGAAADVDRGPRMLELFGATFTLESEQVVQTRAHLDQAELADLLAGSYRCGRHRSRAGLAALDSLEVTLSTRILRLRPLG